MTKIDDELINALHYNDNAWIKQIVKFGNIKIDARAYLRKGMAINNSIYHESVS